MTQNKGEEMREPRWREENGVIYLTVTSYGADCETWLKRLKHFGLGKEMVKLLRSKHFKPTNGVTYEVAILKGQKSLCAKHFTNDIRKKADVMRLSVLNVEIACLISEKFTKKEINAMGLWWIVMMIKPIIGDSDGRECLLELCRVFEEKSFCIVRDSFGFGGQPEYGFAFLLSRSL